MLKSITRILPFLIVTLLSIGGVELFYGVAEHYLVIPEKVSVDEGPVAPSQDQAVDIVKKHTNYGVIVKRNLFKSYHKEPEKKEPVKENPLEGLEATTLDLVLMGTITGRAGKSRAIILEKAKRKQEIYYQGDVVQGAEIKEILRGKVILSFQGNDEILDMSEAAKMKPKAAPAVSPAVPRSRVVSPPKTTPRRRVLPRKAVTRNPAPGEDESGRDIGDNDQDSGDSEGNNETDGEVEETEEAEEAENRDDEDSGREITDESAS